jgi:hypothetical protein
MVPLTRDSRVIIERISGSTSTGGWECSGYVVRSTSVLQQWSALQVHASAIVGTIVSQPRIAFTGYVYRLSAQIDVTAAKETFEAATSHAILERGWLQGIGFVDVETFGLQRAHYHQFDGRDRMTLGKIVRHILGYWDEIGKPPSTNPDWVAHCNLVYDREHNPRGWIRTDIDVYGSAEVSRYIVRESTNLWRTLRDIAANEFYDCYFDRNDVFHYRPHPFFYTPPAPVLTLDRSLLLGELHVEERESRVRQVRLHAVTDAETTMHSDYPRSATHVYGEVIERTGLRCNNQLLLDQWAERLYRWENRPYTLTWTAPGPIGLYLDLNTPVTVNWTGTAADGAHYSWIGETMWVSAVEFQIGEGASATAKLTLEALR